MWRINYIDAIKRLFKKKICPLKSCLNLQNCLNLAWWCRVCANLSDTFFAHKGNSNLMLNRTSKNKRQEEENKRGNDAEKQLAIIGSLKEEVASLKDELLLFQSQKEADRYSDMLYKLYEQKVIDENGNPLSEE